MLVLARMYALIGMLGAAGASASAKRGECVGLIKSRALLIAAAAGALGCEPPLEIGSWKCVAAPLFIPPDGSPILPGRDTTVVPSWTTSFEDGFCGYNEARGYCYTEPDATYSLSDSVTRTGRRAAAFTITTDDTKVGNQTRCVREGFLPQDAYYGAWFFIPRRTVNNDNWNLMHFRGAYEDNELRGMWDVSVHTDDQGRMLPRLLKLLPGRGMAPPQADVELPVAEWFQLQIRLKREATETGIAELYFNDELVAQYTDIVTDDSTWQQWYLGNLATDLDPIESTIYIDDVFIQQSRVSTN